MPATAISIILLSTVMHAGWNLMVRHSRAEVLFVRRMLIAGALLGLLPAVVFEFFQPLGLTTWGLVAASGLCCGFYFIGLAKGYSTSDFTVVYPVARALPVLLVGFADVAVGRWPSGPGWVGLALVVIGCLLVPLKGIRDIRFGHYLQPAMLWILLAAIGTVGYSLIDKVAALHLKDRFGEGPWPAMRYTYDFFLVAAVVYAVLLRDTRTTHSHDHGVGWVQPTLAAALNVASYGLIVWVMQITRQVSYVVACRQFSIVIGVVVAFALFKETGKVVRTAAALIITAGLFVIAVGGGG